MTQRLETAIKRASRLPETVQDAIADEVLARVEAEEEAQQQDSDTPSVPYDRIKHLAGSVKGGPSDLATNKKYLEGLGESSMS